MMAALLDPDAGRCAGPAGRMSKAGSARPHIFKIFRVKNTRLHFTLRCCMMPAYGQTRT